MKTHLCRTWALELTLNSSNNAANLNCILGYFNILWFINNGKIGIKPMTMSYCRLAETSLSSIGTLIHFCNILLQYMMQDLYMGSQMDLKTKFVVNVFTTPEYVKAWDFSKTDFQVIWQDFDTKTKLSTKCTRIYCLQWMCHFFKRLNFIYHKSIIVLNS